MRVLACVLEQALHDALMPPRDFALCGLLPFVMRCLAAKDPSLRALAYEAIALYEGVLAATNFRCRSLAS